MILWMSNSEFSIRRTTSSDWREIRDLRIEMIRDTPTAYAESLEDALALVEADWKLRGERGTAEHGIAIAAISNTDQWIGMMGGFVPDSQTGPLLVGVYVTPKWRGRQVGVTDALLATIEAWARNEGQQLTLHVHEENARAQKYYERQGFIATGRSMSYNLDPTKNELEMVKQLNTPNSEGMSDTNEISASG